MGFQGNQSDFKGRGGIFISYGGCKGFHRILKEF